MYRQTTGPLHKLCPKPRYLVHSLYIFLLQIFLAFQDLVYVTDTSPIFNKHDSVDGVVFFNQSGSHGSSRTIPHSLEWLAGLDRIRLRPSDIPAWYLFLIGELQLREHPDFNVRGLVQCLLALSGSVSLLIIRYIRHLYRNAWALFQRSRSWRLLQVLRQMRAAQPRQRHPSNGGQTNNSLLRRVAACCMKVSLIKQIKATTFRQICTWFQHSPSPKSRY